MAKKPAKPAAKPAAPKKPAPKPLAPKVEAAPQPSAEDVSNEERQLRKHNFGF